MDKQFIQLSIGAQESWTKKPNRTCLGVYQKGPRKANYRSRNPSEHNHANLEAKTLKKEYNFTLF